MSPDRPERTDILGFGVSAVDPTIAMHLLTRWEQENRQRLITDPGLEGLLTCLKHGDLERVHRKADLVLPGDPWLARLSRVAGCRQVAEVGAIDLLTARGLDEDSRLLVAGSGIELESRVIEGFGRAASTWEPGAAIEGEPRLLWLVAPSPVAEVLIPQLLRVAGEAVVVSLGISASELLVGRRRRSHPWTQLRFASLVMAQIAGIGLGR